MPDENIGPPQASPFDDLSDKQRKMFDKALAIADGVKLYHSAGGVGVGGNWAPYAHELAKRGGLSDAEATTLARYRMWKQGLTVPTERMPAPTPEQINARRDQFVAGDPATRSRILDEEKHAIFNGQQGFYDSLVKKPEELSKPLPPEAISSPGARSVPTSTAPPSIAKEEEVQAPQIPGVV